MMSAARKPYREFENRLPELTWAQLNRQLTDLCPLSHRRAAQESLVLIQRSAPTQPTEQILQDLIRLALQVIAPQSAD